MELVIPTSSENGNTRSATDVLEHPRKSTYSKEESSFDDFARDLDWYTTNENLMLDELSKLCRDLHAKLNNFSNFEDFDSLGSSSDQLFGTSKRSCSTEDIANSLGEEAEREEDSNFERSCKTRRSLPAEVKYRLRKTNQDEKQSTLERKFKSGDQSISQALEKKEKFDQDKPEETTEKSRSEKEENRPGKKVGFSKTEIHFAPDTGKVNIVETDGKPPPTNRFRRRRRNHIKNSKHFPVGRTFSAGSADGSFEKYFFGGLLNPDLKRSKETEQQVNQQTAPSETSEKKRDELKNRGHITTINFITDDTNEPTRSVQVDGNGPTENSSSGDQKDSLVTRTTKMTVHIPFTNPDIPHLKNFPLSSLKSVRLILNVNPVVENRKLEDLYSLFYEQSESKSTVQDEEKLNEISSSKASQFTTEKKSDSELLEKIRNCKIKILEEVSPLQSSIVKQEKKHENVLLSDEKNVVSTNVVRSHKPVVSNVEKDYNLKRLGKKSKVLEQPARRWTKNSADEKTWTKNGEMSTYVNAFSGPRGKDELYENVFDMKTTQSKKKVDHSHRTSQKEENSIKKGNSSRSKSSSKSVAKASKTNEKNVKDIKNAGKSLETTNFPVVVTKRLNQPKEFIHKTAVFNMPNETLTKSAKLKQTLRRHK